MQQETFDAYASRITKGNSLCFRLELATNLLKMTQRHAA